MKTAIAWIWLLKPLRGKASQTGSLPIGLNRISWKLGLDQATKSGRTLPIGLNRISWKPNTCFYQPILVGFTLPIGLNRISWKLKTDPLRL